MRMASLKCFAGGYLMPALALMCDPTQNTFPDQTFYPHREEESSVHVQLCPFFTVLDSPDQRDGYCLCLLVEYVSTK
jgi:hypothetical protein